MTAHWQIRMQIQQSNTFTVMLCGFGVRTRAATYFVWFLQCMHCTMYISLIWENEAFLVICMERIFSDSSLINCNYLLDWSVLLSGQIKKKIIGVFFLFLFHIERIEFKNRRSRVKNKYVRNSSIFQNFVHFSS